MFFDSVSVSHHGKVDYTHWKQWPETYRLCHSSVFKARKPSTQLIWSLRGLCHSSLFKARKPNSTIRVGYQNWSWTGIFSGSTFFAGAPIMKYMRSHCARVTKMARTEPSCGTFCSRRRRCVCCREKVTHGRAIFLPMSIMWYDITRRQCIDSELRERHLVAEF